MPPPPDEFSQYVRKPAAAAAPKDEFAQFARPATPTPQPMPAGSFQTMKGAPVQQVSQIGAQPLTYATPGAAVSGAQARAALPEFQQQLTESKTGAREALPVVGSTLGMAGGLGGSAIGAGIGRAMEPVMEGGKPALASGAATAAITYATGKVFESALGTIPYGRRVMKQLLESKDPQQVGDAMKAFTESKAWGLGKQAIAADLNRLATEAGEDYRAALRAANRNLIDISKTEQAMVGRAQSVSSSVKGVTNRVQQFINAAKYNAGITGNTATPEQVAAFKKTLQEVAYQDTTDPISVAVKNIFKAGDRILRADIRSVSPEAAQALDRMSNVHAAVNALENYSPGFLKSVGISAAQHPWAARMIAPLAAGAAYLTDAGTKAKRIAEALP